MSPANPVISDAINPVAGFRFGIELGGQKVAWFTECSGLSVERQVLPQEEGGVNDYVHQLPDRIKYTRVTLKRGIADETLWQWFQDGLYDGKVSRKAVSILLYNLDRTQVKRWNLREAFPVKWSGPDLKTDSSGVAIESLELVHHGMEITAWTGV